MNYPLANLFYRYSELQSRANYRPLQRSASIHLKMSLSKTYKMHGQCQCPIHMPLDIFALCVSGLSLTMGGLGESDLGLMELVLLMGTGSHKVWAKQCLPTSCCSQRTNRYNPGKFPISLVPDYRIWLSFQRCPDGIRWKLPCLRLCPGLLSSLALSPGLAWPGLPDQPPLSSSHEKPLLESASSPEVSQR